MIIVLADHQVAAVADLVAAEVVDPEAEAEVEAMQIDLAVHRDRVEENNYPIKSSHFFVVASS